MAATHPRGVGAAAGGLALRRSPGRQDDAGEDARRRDVPELRPALRATGAGRSGAVLRGLAAKGHGDPGRGASSSGPERGVEDRRRRVPGPPGAGHGFIHARRHPQVSGLADGAEDRGASLPGAVARVRGLRRTQPGPPPAPRRPAGTLAGSKQGTGVLCRVGGQLLRPRHPRVVRRSQSRGLSDAVPAAAATQRRPAGRQRPRFAGRGEPTDREGACGGAADRRRRASAPPLPRRPRRQQAGDRKPSQVLRLRHRLRGPRARLGRHPG